MGKRTKALRDVGRPQTLSAEDEVWLDAEAARMRAIADAFDARDLDLAYDMIEHGQEYTQRFVDSKDDDPKVSFADRLADLHWRKGIGALIVKSKDKRR